MATTLTTAYLYSAPKEQVQDDSGKADGNACFVDDTELVNRTSPSRRVGTRVYGYNYDIQADAFNSLHVSWTGWRVKNYALIDAPVETVKSALEKAYAEYARRALKEELHTLEVAGDITVMPDEQSVNLEFDQGYKYVAHHLNVAYDGQDTKPVRMALYERYLALRPLVQV